MKNTKIVKNDNIDIVTTFICVMIFALICGYYTLTSNAASLKVHPNDASVQNAIMASELTLEDIENGKYSAR